MLDPSRPLRRAISPTLPLLLLAGWATLGALGADAAPQQPSQEQEAPDGLVTDQDETSRDASSASAQESEGESAAEPEGDGDERAAGYDDLYNRVAEPETSDEPVFVEPPAEQDEADPGAPADGDPADAAPTIRTYRPSEEPDHSVGLTEPRDDPGLFGLYFPLTMYPELDARSDELQAWFFLGGLLPAGQAWLPLLVSKEPSPDGFIGDAALLMIVHALPHLAVLGSLPCGVLALSIPVLGPVLFVGVFLLNLANVAAFLATNFYFMPVALVNAYDRAVRAPASTAEGTGKLPQATPMAY